MPEKTVYDWTQFRAGIYIRSRPEEVFPMWATVPGLCRWFLRAAAFAPTEAPVHERKPSAKPPIFDKLTPRPESEVCRAGDRYRWEWYYNDGVVGEDWILEVRPPTRLAFGFGARMKVEVTLRKQGTSCEVNLRQFDIPNTPRGRFEMHMGSRVAWAFFLANLKSVTEGGPDLRETERGRTRQLHLINI